MYSAERAWLAKDMSITEAGCAFGRSEVDESSFAEDIDLASVFCRILFHERADEVGLALTHLFQCGNVDLHVEVTGVGNDRSIPHDFKVLSINYVDITGQGTEEISDLRGLCH